MKSPSDCSIEELHEVRALQALRALLAEQDEEWMSAKIYLNMKP